VAAFTRSLRDPFVHARHAALLALGATADVFDETDCASKVVPAIAPSLVDKEKLVRDQASKAVALYLARIATLTKNYPDTAIPAAAATSSPEAVAKAVAAGGGESVVMPGGWTSWAVGTFAAAAGQMQSRATAAVIAAEERSASAPLPNATTASSASRPQATSTSSIPQPGGFLEAAGDDLDGWGALDEDEETTNSYGNGETFFDALEKKTGKKISGVSSNKENRIASPPAPSAAASTGGVSSFGPKPFSLRNEEEVDFEALVGAKKGGRTLPKGLAKKTTPTPAVRKTAMTTVKKTLPSKKAPPPKKAESWDDGEADWGDDGWA